MKTGLVLEGGGVRGIYTAGVLDVFMEKGIEFDGIIGVSAGAIHACSYLSRQCGRSIRYYKKYSRDPRFMGFRCWLKTGDVVGAVFCYRELPDELDIYDHEAFYANPTPYYVVCSNVESGQAEYMQLSLTAIIRIRTTGCIFAPYIISFFGGRQPTCITQFRLTQKSPPVVSQISERI